jgi:hypothetical protein
VLLEWPVLLVWPVLLDWIDAFEEDAKISEFA